MFENQANMGQNKQFSIMYQATPSWGVGRYEHAVYIFN